MSQQSNPATLRELVRRWNEIASKIANRPTSTPETRAQATGWMQCADELEADLAASGTEAAPYEQAQNSLRYERPDYLTEAQAAEDLLRRNWLGDLGRIPLGKVVEFMQSFAEASVRASRHPAHAAASPEAAPSEITAEQFNREYRGNFDSDRPAASPEGEGREAYLTVEELRSCIFTFADGMVNFATTAVRINNFLRQKALRQSAAPSGGAALTLEQVIAVLQRVDSESVMGDEEQVGEQFIYRNVGPILLTKFLNELFAQESKTGAVTETR